jgi:hypothetical protein
VLDDDSKHSSVEAPGGAPRPRRAFYLENLKPLGKGEFPLLGIGRPDFDWEQLANATIGYMNTMSQPKSVVAKTVHSQKKDHGTDVINDSGEETADEDWMTLGTAALLSKEPKPEQKKGTLPAPKKRKKGSHNRKDQSDPTLAPWAVLPKEIPNDGKWRSKYPFHFQLDNLCNHGPRFRG